MRVTMCSSRTVVVTVLAIADLVHGEGAQAEVEKDAEDKAEGLDYHLFVSTKHARAATWTQKRIRYTQIAV